MNNAMEQYYKLTNDSYDGDIYLYKIQYHEEMLPIMNYAEEAIKQIEVKNMVKLFKKYQWFTDLVFESTRNSINHIFSSARPLE
jgi:hypothetical protein